MYKNEFEIPFFLFQYEEIKTENNIAAGLPLNGQKHAKRALPLSPRSSLPSRPNKRRKLHHSWEKSELKVSEEAYQVFIPFKFILIYFYFHIFL